MLQHHITAARKGVQMASTAKDAKSAIKAAKAVVDAVENVIGCGSMMTSNQVGLKTLQRAADLSTTTAEEQAEIAYTAKLIAAVTYAAAVEAAEAAAAAAEAAADEKASFISSVMLRKRRANKGYRLLADVEEAAATR